MNFCRELSELGTFQLAVSILSLLLCGERAQWLGRRFVLINKKKFMLIVPFEASKETMQLISYAQKVEGYHLWAW
jgi:hypothetical protein